MKSLLATLIVISLFVPTAWASDDGQTQPRLNQGGVLTANSSVDIISTTNGVGNVKGVHCKGFYSFNIKIFVDGGSAQTLPIDFAHYPADSEGEYYTGWIPLNVRFTSSIRVQLQRNAGPVASHLTTCVVSWALD